MRIKVTVKGSSGCTVEEIADAVEQDEVATVISATLGKFRKQCSDSVFDAHVRVDHA